MTEGKFALILLMTTIPPENSPWGIPAKLPPLGLSYVAGALEKAGFEVQMLDNYQMRTTIDFVKQEVQKRKADHSRHNLRFSHLPPSSRNG